MMDSVLQRRRFEIRRCYCGSSGTSLSGVNSKLDPWHILYWNLVHESCATYAPRVHPLNFQGASHAWPRTRSWSEQYNHCGFLALTREVSAIVHFDLGKFIPLNLESSGRVALWVSRFAVGFHIHLDTCYIYVSSPDQLHRPAPSSTPDKSTRCLQLRNRFK